MDKKVRKTEKTTFSLRHYFTNSEKLEKQDTITQLLHEKNRSIIEKKTVMKSYGAKISDIENNIHKENEKVHSGFEYREVPCESLWDYETGNVIIMREDNSEVVHIRPMTAEEKRYQMTIEEKEVEPKFENKEQVEEPGSES